MTHWLVHETHIISYDILRVFTFFDIRDLLMFKNVGNLDLEKLIHNLTWGILIRPLLLSQTTNVKTFIQIRLQNHLLKM